MNSLQILSILTLDKVEELRSVFHISKYYCLLYESEEYDYISLTSKRLFTTEENVADYLLLILSFDFENVENQKEKELYVPCCKLDNDKKWTRQKVKKHFLKHKHYTYNKITYKIIQFEVSK